MLRFYGFMRHYSYTFSYAIKFMPSIHMLFTSKLNLDSLNLSYFISTSTSELE